VAEKQRSGEIWERRRVGAKNTVLLWNLRDALAAATRRQGCFRSCFSTIDIILLTPSLADLVTERNATRRRSHACRWSTLQLRWCGLLTVCSSAATQPCNKAWRVRSLLAHMQAGTRSSRPPPGTRGRLHQRCGRFLWWCRPRLPGVGLLLQVPACCLQYFKDVVPNCEAGCCTWITPGSDWACAEITPQNEKRYGCRSVWNLRRRSSPVIVQVQQHSPSCAVLKGTSVERLFERRLQGTRGSQLLPGSHSQHRLRCVEGPSRPPSRPCVSGWRCRQTIARESTSWLSSSR